MENNNENPPLNKYEQEQIDRIKRRVKYIQEQTAELEKSTVIKDWLKNYRFDGGPDFCKSYAAEKFNWLEWGQLYAEQIEKKELKWLTDAEHHLKIIQQKKLFDMQCLWRAEKIKIKEVDICFDFKVWEHDVFNCPFLEPITEEDVQLYMLYLQDVNCDVGTRLGFMEEWQDYDEIKEAYNTDNETGNFPEWYDFYNGRRGTGVYMQLPDVRGNKEDFYRDIWFAAKEEKQKQENKPPYVPDTRPFLSVHDKEQIKFFVTTFEDKETQRLFNAYTKEMRHIRSGAKESIDEMVDLLMEADEYVPMQAHYNWFEALEICVKNYKCKKISEALPEAYSQYRMNIDNGIAFPAEKRYQDVRKVWADSIIQGRVLNGEPADFNF